MLIKPIPPHMHTHARTHYLKIDHYVLSRVKKKKSLYLGCGFNFCITFGYILYSLKIIPIWILCLQSTLRFKCFKLSFQRLVCLTTDQKKKKVVKNLEEDLLALHFLSYSSFPTETLQSPSPPYLSSNV